MHGLNEHRYERFLFLSVPFEVILRLCWFVGSGWLALTFLGLVWQWEV
jgi:hypothetical protein